MWENEKKRIVIFVSRLTISISEDKANEMAVDLARNEMWDKVVTLNWRGMTLFCNL